MKLYLESLGCDKNRVDSEKLLSELLEKYEGSEVTLDPSEADIAIVNTCSFIGPAKEESINTILDLAEYKKSGRLKKLIVAGCLVERYKDEIRKELPEIDEIASVKDYVRRLDSQMKRVESGERYTRYLKIAEGCDKYCSYCIIPRLRGHFRSIPMDMVLEEARELVEDGAKELILVAQETTLYGTDLYGKKSLHLLLHALSEIEGLVWIRVLYCYPEEITDELIDTIASEEKICHYLDIPIQHASDRILRRMARRTNQNDLKEIVEKLRKKIPDITLRTTLITGFPGETEEDFEILKDFVDEMQFERLGVFTYSEEEGTIAAGFENQVDEEVKEARREEIMLLQQEISLAHLQSLIGEELDVVIEGNIPDDGVYIGRTYMDVPGVDGYVFVESDRNHMSGDFVRVKITGASEYDLMGELV